MAKTVEQLPSTSFMHLGKPAKILIAIATAWPLVYMFFFVAFMFSTVLRDFSGSDTHSSPPATFKLLFVLHFLTILWIFGLLAFYITYLFKSERVTQDKKALWAVVLFFGNMIAMPVFWYLYVWREPPAVPPKIA